MSTWHAELHFYSTRRNELGDVRSVDAEVEAALLLALRSFSPRPARACRAGCFFEAIFHIDADSEFDASVSAVDIAARVKDYINHNDLVYEGFTLTSLSKSEQAKRSGFLVVFRDQKRRLTIEADYFRRMTNFGVFEFYRETGKEESLLATFEISDVAAVISINSFELLVPAYYPALRWPDSAQNS